MKTRNLLLFTLTTRVGAGSSIIPIYINDITALNLSSNSRLTLYADDILLYKPIRCKTSFQELQQDIDHLAQWSDNHMLSFNVSKYKCMLLSNRHNINPPPLLLNNQSLEFVQEYKYLGVILTRKTLLVIPCPAYNQQGDHLLQYITQYK